MKKVLILAGWGGSNFPHWQSWLAGEIAKDYGKVSFFKFSNFELPDKETWKNELIEEVASFQPDIIVCHSIASILWFHICNELYALHSCSVDNIAKLFLVAPPSLTCKIPELASFYPCKIPKNLYAKEVILVSSTDDPYMTQNEAKELQEALHVEMKVLENAGHINSNSSFGKWPWMLEQVNK